MLYTGVSRLLNINLGDIVPSERDREEFIAAVVKGEPFQKRAAVAQFKILFVSPSAADYDALGAASRDQYEAYLMASTINLVIHSAETIYIRSDGDDLQTAFQKLRTALGNSVVIPHIVREWFIFITTFTKLLEESLRPDFFTNIQSGKQQSEQSFPG